MKNSTLICIGVLLTTSSIAQVSGPNDGSKFTTVPISGAIQTWAKVYNAQFSDDLYSTFGDLTGGIGSHTDYLVATGFGLNIPKDAIITGIVAQVERSDPDSASSGSNPGGSMTSDYSIRIVKNDQIGASEHSIVSFYPIHDSYQIYGKANDLWGETWLPDDINSTSFGVAIAAQRSVAGGATAGQVDDIQIIVYYTFTTLAVKITSFSLKKSGKAIQLDWNVAEESNMQHYEIERSQNGIDFSSVGSVPCRNLAGAGQYSFDDQNPLQGISYYRLKTVSIGGAVNYSKIISVQYSTGNVFSLYPNPWQKGNDLFITNPNHELLTVQFFNSSGQIVSTSTTSSEKIEANALAPVTGLSWYRIYNIDHSQQSTGILLNPPGQ